MSQCRHYSSGGTYGYVYSNYKINDGVNRYLSYAYIKYWRRLGKVKYPSRPPLLLDADAYSGETGADVVNYDNYPNEDYFVQYRHNSCANVLYFDGHVGSIKSFSQADARDNF